MIKFLTFSKKNCSRLKYRAIECNWFDKVKAINNCQKDLQTIILKSLDNMADNDILVYADEFSEINLNGKYIFLNERISHLKNYDIIISECENIQKKLMYIKKTDFSIYFFKHFEEFDKLKNDSRILKLKPNLKLLQALTFSTNEEIRLSDNDILPNCKIHYYEPFSMFVVGHVLPIHEINYDMYTHFINVGDSNIDRVSANEGVNIKNHQDLAELTALYWIWKNLDINDLDVIGFSTYRKPFLIKNSVAYEMIKSGKIDCVANKYALTNFSRIHKLELGEENIKEFKDIVKSLMSNEEYDAFINDYENSRYVYICNSFYMPRNRFNEFCENVFKIMLPVSEKMKNKFGNKDHRPCPGCFSEAVSSFYLKKMFKNVFAAPFLIYPLFKEYYNQNLQYYDPQIFGVINNNENREIFYPQGVFPPKTNTKEITSGFYSENDIVRSVNNRIAKTRGILIK